MTHQTSTLGGAPSVARGRDAKVNESLQPTKYTSSNIALPSDGTGKEPKLLGERNFLRPYKMLPIHDGQQVVWYDPGVGHRGIPWRSSKMGRAITKFAGQGLPRG